jgi:hypothetical protein
MNRKAAAAGCRSTDNTDVLRFNLWRKTDEKGMAAAIDRQNNQPTQTFGA